MYLPSIAPKPSFDSSVHPETPMVCFVWFLHAVLHVVDVSVYSLGSDWLMLI